MNFGGIGHFRMNSGSAEVTNGAGRARGISVFLGLDVENRYEF